MEFKEWLNEQKERKDRIGKLARAFADREVKYYSRRRKRDEHRKWADIITRHGTHTHVVSFNRAWREYKKAKKVAEAKQEEE